MATKSTNVMIRLTPRDRARLQRLAETDYLEAATWARQVLLRALDVAEAEVAAAPPADTKKPARKRAGGRRTS